MHPNDFVPCLDRARCSDGRVDPTAHCCNNLHAFECTRGILGRVKLPEGEASGAAAVRRETSLPERRLPLGETSLGSAGNGIRQCSNERVDLSRRG